MTSVQITRADMERLKKIRRDNWTASEQEDWPPLWSVLHDVIMRATG